MVEQIELTNEQIISSENKLIEAIRIGDLTPLDVLLKDSTIFTHSFNHKENSFNRLAYDSYQVKISEVSTSDRSVITINDFTFVTVIFNLKENYFEQSIDKKFKYLSVWKFYENMWRLMVCSGFQI